METTLDVAERATKWLESGGGWAVSILMIGVIIVLARYIVALHKENKAERDVMTKEHKEAVDKKDAKIFELLDKQNTLLVEIQKRGPQ